MTSHNYTIKIEKWSELIEGLLPSLVEEHWNEVARNKHLMVLKPDFNRYKALDDVGALVSLFAYADDEIVGYSVNILQPHLHYADLLVGYNDLLFLSEKWRNSPVGIRLIKETEKELKLRGAKLMFWHAKENTSLAKILPRMKCNVQEIVFSKEL